VNEVLAANKVSFRDLGTVANGDALVEFGIEARRKQFDKNSYRQPVLTQKSMLPSPYRRDQSDPMTEESRSKLRELQDYSLMTDSVASPSASETERLASVDENKLNP
jgi:hypothetical protein